MKHSMQNSQRNQLLRFNFGVLVIMFFTIVQNIPLCGQGIRMATFNIRVDTEKDSMNQWKYRKGLLCEFIAKEELDFFCLQEVLSNQKDYISSYFPEYICVSAGRVDGQNCGDAVPIFYLGEKFECLDSGTFWLSETPDSIGSIGWDARYPRIATWVKLKTKNSEDIFFVFNTHLDHRGMNAKKHGMELIKDSIGKICNETPTILTGDFNSIPKSEVCKIAISKNVLMLDSYKCAKYREGQRYTYHAFGKTNLIKRCKRIDYVFITDQIRVNSLFIPKEKDVNGVFLSDHNPIIVYLSILKKQQELKE